MCRLLCFFPAGSSASIADDSGWAAHLCVHMPCALCWLMLWACFPGGGAGHMTVYVLVVAVVSATGACRWAAPWVAAAAPPPTVGHLRCQGNLISAPLRCNCRRHAVWI